MPTVGRRNERSLGVDLMKGAIAGGVATWAMGLVTNYLYSHENWLARTREDEARGGETAYEHAADKLADKAGLVLSEQGQQKAGRALHWVLGIGAGAAYAALRGRIGGLEFGRGLGFGTSFWLVVDEALTPLLGLTPGPDAFPWQTHVRGLAGHLVFGTVADTTLDLLDRVA